MFASKVLIVFAIVVSEVQASQVIVSALASHSPDAWDKAASGGCDAAKGRALAECNLQVYTASIASAAEQGAQLLVFPESYGLGGEAAPDDFYEPLSDEAVGTLPCFANNSTLQPVQTGLGCAAATHGVALAANLQTEMANGTRHITEIIFDAAGKIVSVYHKHSLFATEGRGVTPGPFAPTSFEMFGQRWGVVICYEGIKPFVSRDFSQFDELVKQQGSTALVWSVGGTEGILGATASKLAKRYGVKVLATEDSDRFGGRYGHAVIMDEMGNEVNHTNATIDGLANIGYTGKAFIKIGAFNFNDSIVV